MGFSLSIRIIALGALVYAGAFAAAVNVGTSLLLAMTVVASLSVLILPTVPDGVFSTTQEAPIAVLMPVILAMNAVAGTLIPTDTAIATVFAIIGVTSILTGVVLVLIGVFDLSRVARLMPYSVLAGYLGSAGLLLMISALEVTLGQSIVSLVTAGAGGEVFLRLALALAFAVFLYVAHRRMPGVGLIVAFAVSVALFFAGLRLFGVSLAEARGMGLLPPATAPGAGSLWSPAILLQADTGRVLEALPTILSAVMVGTLGMLLNMSGVELATRADIEAKGVLRNTGLANVVLGAFGGGTGFLSASNTAIAMELGGLGRAVPLTAIAVVSAAIFVLTRVVEYIPTFVTVGLLVQMGWLVFDRWVLKTRDVFSRWDWITAVGIVLASLVFGMVTAVGLGIVAASLTFAVTYAQLPVIKRSSTLAQTRSAVDRGRPETELLDVAGQSVAIVYAQGFLFFGTVEQLVESARVRLRTETPVHALIFDFSNVTGIDVSAAEALKKIEFIAAEVNAEVVVAQASDEVRTTLVNSGLFAPGKAFSYCETLDNALQQAEERLFDEQNHQSSAEGAKGALLPLVGDAQKVDRLLDLMERRPVASGEYLIRAGATDSDVFLIDTGRMGVFVTVNGAQLRVRSMRAGAFVGEIASYAGLPRTADVVAEEDSVVYVLSPEILAQHEQDDPALIALWHRVMAAALADKLNRTNEILRERA